MKRLILSSSAYENIKTECLSHSHLETGGILVGGTCGEDIVVPLSLGSGPKAKRTLTRFEPDVEWQQERLNLWFEKHGLNYVGSYHRHPGKMSWPSSTDYRTAKDILSCPDWDMAEAIFPIIILTANDISIYPYYMSRQNNQFEFLPLYLLPDNHFRFKRLAVTLGSGSIKEPFREGGEND